MPYQPIDELLIEHRGPVALVTLNNPDGCNSFLDEMHLAMRGVWEHLALDESVRSIVLSG